MNKRMRKKARRRGRPRALRKNPLGPLPVAAGGAPLAPGADRVRYWTRQTRDGVVHRQRRKARYHTGPGGWNVATYFD